MSRHHMNLNKMKYKRLGMAMLMGNMFHLDTKCKQIHQSFQCLDCMFHMDKQLVNHWDQDNNNPEDMKLNPLYMYQQDKLDQLDIGVGPWKLSNKLVQVGKLCNLMIRDDLQMFQPNKELPNLMGKHYHESIKNKLIYLKPVFVGIVQLGR